MCMSKHLSMSRIKASFLLKCALSLCVFYVNDGWSQPVSSRPLITQISEGGREAEDSSSTGDIPQRLLTKARAHTSLSRVDIARVDTDDHNSDGTSEEVIVKGTSSQRRPVERGRSY